MTVTALLLWACQMDSEFGALQLWRKLPLLKQNESDQRAMEFDSNNRAPI
jgi:hypothetical protein